MRAVDKRSYDEVHTVVHLNCKTCPALGCLGRVVAPKTVIHVRRGYESHKYIDLRVQRRRPLR